MPSDVGHAGALGNLAWNNTANRDAIREAGAIPPLVALVTSGAAGGRQEAAGALHGLAWNNVANQAAIVAAGGIPPLVALVRSGAADGQEQAAAALGWLACDNAANQAAIVEAGVVGPLVALVRAGGSLGAKAAAEALAKLDLAVISSRVEPPQAKEASRKRRLEAPECVVCFERARAVAFVPCGHFCVCSKCGQRLSECPICRKSTRKQRIYT